MKKGTKDQDLGSGWLGNYHILDSNALFPYLAKCDREEPYLPGLQVRVDRPHYLKTRNVLDRATQREYYQNTSFRVFLWVVRHYENHKVVFEKGEIHHLLCMMLLSYIRHRLIFFFLLRDKRGIKGVRDKEVRYIYFCLLVGLRPVTPAPTGVQDSPDRMDSRLRGTDTMKHSAFLLPFFNQLRVPCPLGRVFSTRCYLIKPRLRQPWHSSTHLLIYSFTHLLIYSSTHLLICPTRPGRANVLS